MDKDKSSFPDGFDAVQAAPKSHRVILENAFVRVLEVSTDASPPLAESPSQLGHRPQVTTCSLPSCGRECSRHSEYGRGNSSRSMERGVDEARTHARH